MSILKGPAVEKRREDDIRKNIMSWGYEYCPVSSLPKEILNIGRFCNQEDLHVNHVVKGRIQDCRFVLFDISYHEELMDNSRSAFFKTYIAFEYDKLLPDIEIEPKNAVYRFFQVIGRLIAYFAKENFPVPIWFSDDRAFNKEYAVLSNAPDKAKRLVTDGFRRNLCADKEKWLFWAHDKWAVMISWYNDSVTGDHRVEADKIKQYVERCYGIVEKLDIRDL